MSVDTPCNSLAVFANALKCGIDEIRLRPVENGDIVVECIKRINDYPVRYAQFVSTRAADEAAIDIMAMVLYRATKDFEEGPPETPCPS